MSRALSSRLGHVAVFLGDTLYFHRVLSTQDYKWVLLSRKPDEMWGGGGTSNGLTSNLGRGGGVKPKPKNLLDQPDEKKIT